MARKTHLRNDNVMFGTQRIHGGGARQVDMC